MYCHSEASEAFGEGGRENLYKDPHVARLRYVTPRLLRMTEGVLRLIGIVQVKKFVDRIVLIIEGTILYDERY